jgi:hypothetical protein
MNKLVRFALVAAIVFATVALGGYASVEAQTKFPAYTSGVQVANLGTAAANITLTAYNPDGTQNGAPTTDSIPVDSSKTYFPISNVSAGFNGSIVVSSNQNVAALSNILDSTFKAGASYVGRSSGGTTVYLPLLNKENSGFTTWFSIQNAGSQDANITVNYSDGLNDTATIKPGAAKVFYQSQKAHPGAVFAATVTSNQPVVAAVIQESTQVMFAYTGFTGGGPNPVFPLINANNANYITGLQIQNQGTDATSVTVSYTPGLAGTACTETQTINGGASATFALFAFNGSTIPNGGTTTCVKEKFVGSAKVTANSTNQNLVGVGNQLLPGVNGEAYGSFTDADGGKVVSMPLIMDRNSGFFTGFSVQNVGTAATQVNCTFSNSSYTVSGNLQPDGALSDIQNGKIANGYVGAATCTGADANAKLVAVVNQLRSSNVDNFLVYEGVKK